MYALFFFLRRKFKTYYVDSRLQADISSRQLIHLQRKLKRFSLKTCFAFTAKTVIQGSSGTKHRVRGLYANKPARANEHLLKKKNDGAVVLLFRKVLFGKADKNDSLVVTMTREKGEMKRQSSIA